MKPELLNVDLEVVSKVDPTPLAKALNKKAGVQYCGRLERDYLAAFGSWCLTRSLERKLAAFCDLLEALPPPAAHVWKQASRRTFDIGISSGAARPILSLRIKPATLARITALGATIAVTVYPVMEWSRKARAS